MNCRRHCSRGVEEKRKKKKNNTATLALWNNNHQRETKKSRSTNVNAWQIGVFCFVLQKNIRLCWRVDTFKLFENDTLFCCRCLSGSGGGGQTNERQIFFVKITRHQRERTRNKRRVHTIGREQTRPFSAEAGGRLKRWLYIHTHTHTHAGTSNTPPLFIPGRGADLYHPERGDKTMGKKKTKKKERWRGSCFSKRWR